MPYTLSHIAAVLPGYRALSRAQVDSCRRNGLDVRLADARTVTRETFGGFDAVANIVMHGTF